MKSSITNTTDSERELEIEVSPEELDSFKNQALESLGKEVELQGFRKGTAPKELVAKVVTPEHVLGEASKLAVREGYVQAIKEHNLEPLGSPEVRITKLADKNPLVFKVVVSVLPEMKLPDYKSIARKVEKKKVEVQEKEVQKALEWLQESRKKENQELPELSDEFAKSMGSFENLAALKESIKEGLVKEKELQESDRVRQEILEKVVEQVHTEVPSMLIEQERQSLKEEMQRGAKETLDQATLQEQAVKRVKGFMVLREIAKKENITLDPKEVEEEMGKMLLRYPDPKAAKKQLDSERLKTYTEGVLLNEKTFQLLEQLTL